MRLLGRLAVATSVSALAGLGLVMSGATAAHAQANTCTGNNVIEQAPYSCTETRVINNITFTITLNVDATGQAVVDFTMDPVQQADVPIVGAQLHRHQLRPPAVHRRRDPGRPDDGADRRAPHRVRSARHEGGLHHAGRLEPATSPAPR